MAPTEAPLLILGGTGTVGSRIVQQLASSSIPALVASRSGSGKNGVIFDWHDRKTWNNPYEKGGVRAVYLIAPPMIDAASVMMDFVDFAREKGTKRFVLQSASSIEPGGPAMGKVHAYLRELGTRGEVDWAVLRPTWFQREYSPDRFAAAVADARF
jgi:festuclavine dehydrogenase